MGFMLVAACARQEPPSPGQATIKVTTTIGMIADAARNIGGPNFEVVELMGPGIDPHLYRPTAGDLARIEGADVVLHLGLELEGRMGQVFESLQGTKQTVRAVGESIPKEMLIEVQGVSGKHDPHVWFDPSLWSIVVADVAKTLAERSPEHKSEIESRLRQYQAELAKLDREIRQTVSHLRPEARVLVTAHDAFHYFGKAYGFEVVGIQGVSTASEASPADIRRLARFLADRKVKAIFVETSLSPGTVKALQESSSSLGWKVEIGGSLFSDALGDKETPEGTYFGMVRHNVRTIVEALQ